ncbi:PAS domain S-box-containing protein/diguanylate cyclase (GGDEF)-like protein [Lentzea atacamensis]|uniref:PAS domain S-box-containing protein/diguanylate cyclase (GGDEF)-like protein n=2 Tax=Lentzea TaxID=165301 RepID=A0A316HKN1_9PSEU|nr:diguanylate cyclase [Lentzea atacamensis]PWK81791.1 PAS domain S-box-containing protein/diguanylate cyclase (GGDEF)-like protein [Lentzea atacamensis]RAS62995.1 PAS domain S-box-containing protein/diguanylate cyclase (GGDEF)-like protein [Lentzea atacamensis]
MELPELAARWMHALTSTAYIPLSHAEIEQALLDSLVELPESPESVADRLVSLHATGPDSLRATIEVLFPTFELPLLARLSSAYAHYMRMDAFDQQEQIKVAIVRAKQRVERTLKVSQARFQEVFASSALGIVIIDFDGRCVEANDTLAEIVGLRAGTELIGRELIDFFHPEDRAALAGSYRKVRAGHVDRFRDQRKLIREDGEPVWVHLAASLLRDADGEPTHHVTMVEDISELHLLQRSLDHQLLHDSLTGLSNRQHFITQVERRLGNDAITLYHLGLDAFSVVNNGLGHETGDKLLKIVASRLGTLAAEKKALVARIGGDEFAMMTISDHVTTTVEEIQATLAEATFVDDHGIALSASIGVVDRPPAFVTAAELMRCANAALRQAKARGKRQWALHDPHDDARRRGKYALAASMPGAWEHGELEIVYAPVHDLETREVLGVVARLHWDDLSHNDTMALADSTGLSLPIGKWLLREACAQAAGWVAEFGDRAPTLHITLGALQSRDEDLVADVKRALDETGLPAERLRIALDISSVLAGDDNAVVLHDSGIVTALDGFRGGHDELAVLTEVPVRTVITRAPAPSPESPLRQAMRDLITTVHSFGVRFGVDEVRTLSDAEHWRSIGADGVIGLLPALSAAEVTKLLTTAASPPPAAS